MSQIGAELLNCQEFTWDCLVNSWQFSGTSRSVNLNSSQELITSILMPDELYVDIQRTVLAFSEKDPEA